MTIPRPQTVSRRPHGALKTWLATVGIGVPVLVPANDVESLRTGAYRIGLRASIRKHSRESTDRVFTILGPI